MGRGTCCDLRSMTVCGPHPVRVKGAREYTCAVLRTISSGKKTLPETSPLPWIFTSEIGYAPEIKPNQRRTQNPPTRYYDQAPAMNSDLAVSWGRGVWVSVGDIGRVGPGWPTGIETTPSDHSR